MTTETTQGASLLAALRQDRTAAAARMNEMATAARDRSMTDDEQHDFDAAAREIASLDGQIAAAQAGGSGAPEKTVAPEAGTIVGRAEAAEIAKLCVNGGMPGMAATLLAEGVGLGEARARVAAAAGVESMVNLARGLNASIPQDLAATMLAEGKSVQEIRAALFDRIVATEEKTTVFSQKPAGGTAASGASKPVDLVADMKLRHGVKA